MGKPKALVSFCGAPLICRGLKRLGAIADQLIITSNQHESLDFLCQSVTGDRLEIYSDLYDVRGALNGLYTALYYANQPTVAVVACDMVFPSSAVLKAEQRVLIETGADLVIPRTSHGYEPFHAVYRRSTCLPIIKRALEAGETRATGWYHGAKLVEFTLEDVLAADPRGGSFVNVNTPEELQNIEQRILAGEMTTICSEDSTDTSSGERKHTCGYKAP